MAVMVQLPPALAVPQLIHGQYLFTAPLFWALHRDSTVVLMRAQKLKLGFFFTFKN